MTTFLTWLQIWESTILNETGTSDKYRFSQHRDYRTHSRLILVLQLLSTLSQISVTLLQISAHNGNKNCSENFREQLTITVRHSQVNLRNISLSSLDAWGALERQQQENVPKANVLAGGVHRWLSSSFLSSFVSDHQMLPAPASQGWHVHSLHRKKARAPPSTVHDMTVREDRHTKGQQQDQYLLLCERREKKHGQENHFNLSETELKRSQRLILVNSM